jgi:hypothetical protein
MSTGRTMLIVMAASLAGATARAAEPDPACATGQACGRAPVVTAPYLGVSSLQQGDVNLGLRAGALLGGRVSEDFFIGGELTLDRASLHDTSTDLEGHEYFLQAALSPLYVAEKFDQRLVIGPRVGVWRLTGNAPGGADVDGHGWMIGVNLGLFLRVRQTTALGVLVSYTDLIPPSSEGNAQQILGFTLAAMFDLAS